MFNVYVCTYVYIYQPLHISRMQHKKNYLAEFN